MKAVGKYAIIVSEEDTTASGIKMKHDNIGLVLSCSQDPSLDGRKVIYNNDTIYKKEGKYIFVPFDNIFAVLPKEEGL